MTDKLSSYQKLKNEVADLKQDLYNLTCSEDTLSYLKVRMKWQTYFEMEAALWFGDNTNFRSNKKESDEQDT